MKKNKKEKLGQTENEVQSDSLEKNLIQKRVEISEEDRQLRLAIGGMLREGREDLIKARAEREKKKRLEIVELQSGARFTISEIERIVSVNPQTYAPLFPYRVPFFEQMYRIYYPDRNYKEYPKPYYFSKLFRILVYDRFDKSIYPALDNLNPLVTGRCRVRKLFQHLNSVGQSEVIQFRGDAITVAKSIPTNGDSYSFRKKMWELHKVPFQLDYFKEKKN